jgi:hypothetical protein
MYNKTAVKFTHLFMASLFDTRPLRSIYLWISLTAHPCLIATIATQRRHIIINPVPHTPESPPAIQVDKVTADRPRGGEGKLANSETNVGKGRLCLISTIHS